MITLKLPVYWTNVKKTKPNVTHLFGMNWFRNAFFFSQNTAKKHFQKLIIEQLGTDPIKFTGKYKVTYTYHYKSRVSDLMNVTSMISKVVNDALQEVGVVVDDNVQYCIEEHCYVGERHKDDPHCIVVIEGV